jgi:hypothetical protein
MSDTPKEKAPRVLSPVRIQMTEHANAFHTVTLEEGTQPEEVENPAFWAHVAVKFSPYDEVRVRTDDGLWYGRALVLSCGRNWARVKFLERHILATADVDQTAAAQLDSDFEVKFRGPLAKFAVVRKSDGAVLRDGMMKEEAYRWLGDHLKTIA